jgi:hypothetical protein
MEMLRIRKPLDPKGGDGRREPLIYTQTFVLWFTLDYKEVMPKVRDSLKDGNQL